MRPIWWRDIVRLGEGENGRWFWYNMESRIGDGRDTSFWDGLWVDERNIFSRLFRLCLQQDNSIRGWAVGRRGGGNGRCYGEENFLKERWSPLIS